MLVADMAFAGRRTTGRKRGAGVRGLALGGVVQRGDGRGRALGFPTANLAADAAWLADGVYAGRAFVDGAGDDRAALIVVGASPTFAGVARRVEAHLLDFAGDLYGRLLRLIVEARLGDLRAYPSPGALAEAIRVHAAAARRALGCRAAPPPKGGPSWS